MNPNMIEELEALIEYVELHEANYVPMRETGKRARAILDAHKPHPCHAGWVKNMGHWREIRVTELVKQLEPNRRPVECCPFCNSEMVNYISCSVCTAEVWGARDVLSAHYWVAPLSPPKPVEPPKPKWKVAPYEFGAEPPFLVQKYDDGSVRCSDARCCALVDNCPHEILIEMRSDLPSGIYMVEPTE